jgi:hypothetical protein
MRPRLGRSLFVGMILAATAGSLLSAQGGQSGTVVGVVSVKTTDLPLPHTTILIPAIGREYLLSREIDRLLSAVFRPDSTQRQ